jgi:hypothetical protein
MKTARWIMAGIVVLAVLPRLAGQARDFLSARGIPPQRPPFRIMAGEIHYQRIPREYWADRLAKVKAAGLNTVGTYVFWNALEPEPGQWDLSGGNDLAAFIRTAQRLGLWVIVRPGPYACAEWDFGGLPAWLLRTPDIKVRCSDPRFLAACESYVLKIGEIIRDLQVHRGGPVLMVQVENEYGSFGNDRDYLFALKGFWDKAGIEVPLFTADGATPHMLEAGSLPGAAIGLDPGTNEKHFAEAERLERGVPVFCSELYPGWLTHWGEEWARVKTEDVLRDLGWLLDNGKSFSLYMFHGGTNFGFFAGANFSDRYQPDVTSYDYDAPLDEAGRPTPKYHAIRDRLARHQPKGEKLPDLPEPADDPRIRLITLDESVPFRQPAAGRPQPPARADGILRPELRLHPLPDEAPRPPGRQARRDGPPRLRRRLRRRPVRGDDRPDEERDVPRHPQDRAGERDARHPGRGHGTHQLRTAAHRPQGHHRPGHAERHDPDGLGRPSAPARRGLPQAPPVRRPAGRPAGELLPRPLRSRRRATPTSI